MKTSQYPKTETVISFRDPEEEARDLLLLNPDFKIIIVAALRGTPKPRDGIHRVYHADHLHGFEPTHVFIPAAMLNRQLARNALVQLGRRQPCARLIICV